MEALRQELERMSVQKESEIEQLRSSLQVSMPSHSIAETASREAENGKFTVQKLQEELEIEKESNSSLNF